MYSEIEISKKLRITKKCSFIDIWSININRIENKLNELIYICNNQLPEFVLIQETYHTMPLYINNYICIDQFKDNNNHGMLMLIRKNIECSYEIIYNKDDIQIINIHIGNEILKIINVYMPHNSSRMITNELTIKSYIKNNVKTYILGDWNKEETKNNIFHDYNKVQVIKVNSGTRQVYNIPTSTEIDYGYQLFNKRLGTAKKLSYQISDHYIISYRFLQKYKINDTTKITFNRLKITKPKYEVIINDNIWISNLTYDEKIESIKQKYKLLKKVKYKKFYEIYVSNNKRKLLDEKSKLCKDIRTSETINEKVYNRLS
ncbi:hypothetical protein EHP00_1910 [Ecytonucleospora hepatopenaei]|uniref:Endonuclease/exonuclease/phosphatase domain-containing protein n=1 Tax=Ecytonucleospora hepatopenaei TaxID=646526 RepID=A0A1W0E2A5_9MICR|nr:hypothetical protein EHP00_1910 [Ecytonucleospora hepatopenaei]